MKSRGTAVVAVCLTALVMHLTMPISRGQDSTDEAIEGVKANTTMPVDDQIHEPPTVNMESPSDEKTDAAVGDERHDDEDSAELPKALADVDEDTLEVMCEDALKEALEMDEEGVEEKVDDDGYAEKVDLSAAEYQEKGDLADEPAEDESEAKEPTLSDSAPAEHDVVPHELGSEDKDHHNVETTAEPEHQNKGGALAEGESDDSIEKPGYVGRPVTITRPAISYRPAMPTYRPAVSTYRPYIPRAVPSSVGSSLRSYYSGGARPSYIRSAARPVARSSFTGWARAGYRGGTRTAAYRNLVRYSDNRIRGGSRRNLQTRIASARNRSQNRPVTITRARGTRRTPALNNSITSGGGDRRALQDRLQQNLERQTSEAYRNGVYTSRMRGLEEEERQLRDQMERSSLREVRNNTNQSNARFRSPFNAPTNSLGGQRFYDSVRQANQAARIPPALRNDRFYDNVRALNNQVRRADVLGDQRFFDNVRDLNNRVRNPEPLGSERFYDAVRAANEMARRNSEAEARELRYRMNRIAPFIQEASRGNMTPVERARAEQNSNALRDIERRWGTQEQFPDLEAAERRRQADDDKWRDWAQRWRFNNPWVEDEERRRGLTPGSIQPPPYYENGREITPSDLSIIGGGQLQDRILPDFDAFRDRGPRYDDEFGQDNWNPLDRYRKDESDLSDSASMKQSNEQATDNKAEKVPSTNEEDPTESR